MPKKSDSLNLLSKIKTMIAKINERESYVYLSLFFTTIILHIPYLLSNKPGTDEAMFIVCSNLVNNGFQLYSEIYSMYPPVLIYFFAIIIKFFGLNLTLMRLIMAIVNSIIVIFAYRISRSLFTKEVGLLSALLMCICISHPYFGWYYVRSDSFMLAFSFIGLSFSISAKSKISTNHNLGAGIMFGLSVLSKQTGFLFIPVYFLSVYIFNQGKSSVSKLLSSIFFLILGFLVPILTFILFFIYNNSLESFVNQVLLDSLTGGPGSSLSDSNVLNFKIFIPLFEMFTKFSLIFVLGLGAFLAKCIDILKHLKKILIDNKEKDSNLESLSEYIYKNQSDIILMGWFIIILVFYLLTTIRTQIYFIFYRQSV